jgi:serine/threonine protein kinase
LVHHQPVADGNAPTMTETMTPKTDPGMVMGTAGYMSPEQVRGTTADHRTDIFALGAILYEMLTGRRAFQRSTSAETMAAILNENPPGHLTDCADHCSGAAARRASLPREESRATPPAAANR